MRMNNLKKRIIPILLICFQTTVCLGKEATPIRVFLAGDSTVKTYGPALETGGWGEYLQNYFDKQKVIVINKAEGGRSTRSFINEGRLAGILNQMQAGDYLFIQFGHNDSAVGVGYQLERSVQLGEPDEDEIYPVIPGEKVPTPASHISAYGKEYYPYESGTFKWYLKQYVDGARAKGALPVLITPVSRRYFTGSLIRAHHGPHDAYVMCVLQLAEELDVPCLDMFAKTKALYETLGPAESTKLQSTKTDGSLDNTHYNKYGAFLVAGMVAETIKEEGLPLADFLVAPTEIVNPPADKK